MRLVFQWAAGLALALLAGGQAAAPADPRAEPPSVKATIVNRQGEAVGEASFAQGPRGVLVQVAMTGLQAGPHGFHVHAVGKCEPLDFATAGPHLNPGKARHGLLSPEGHHAGDMPNLVASQDGAARAQVFLPGVALGALLDQDGSALVVHAKPDDHRTDPSGGSGDRVGCGVIGAPR